MISSGAARRRIGYSARLAAVAVAALAAAACAPRARPLTGVAAAITIPATALPAVPQLYRFEWAYADETFDVRGEGVVRTGPPDRARLDLFVASGYGGGMAILDGDSLFVPGIDLIRRFLPPPPLLWASLGRVALPPGRDTTVRLDGDTLRADIAGAARDARTWRVHFSGRDLVRIERIEDQRVLEWAERVPDGEGRLRLRYVHTGGRRSLSLAVSEILTIQEGFDDAIWRRP
jgi:hypothetical protein